MVPSVMSMEMLYKANNQSYRTTTDIWHMGYTEKGAKWQLLNTNPVMEVDKETIFSLVRLNTFTK
jgi:hypothetical protein